MTTISTIKYLLRIVDEPNEEPIGLTQGDFDQLVNLGKSIEIDESRKLVDFATLETIGDEEQFMFEGEALSADEAARYCGQGLESVLRSLLDSSQSD